MSKEYTAEFKKSAVTLSEHVGVREASLILSVPGHYIYAWGEEASAFAEKPPGGLLPGESPEEGFARAEKELSELRLINGILRRAWSFYTYPCKRDIAL